MRSLLRQSEVSEPDLQHTYMDGTYALRDGLQPVRMEGNYFTDLVNERAANFVRKNAGKPFFLYVPHNMPHTPLFASK